MTDSVSFTDLHRLSCLKCTLVLPTNAITETNIQSKIIKTDSVSFTDLHRVSCLKCTLVLPTNAITEKHTEQNNKNHRGEAMVVFLFTYFSVHLLAIFLTSPKRFLSYKIQGFQNEWLCLKPSGLRVRYQ